MRVSQFPLNTARETPADAEIISHQLMLRAGLIRKLASGLYSWLPLGVRVLHKVEQIVREEMQNAGALELLMPAVQPAELWRESGRWEKYGPELLRLKDRHERDFCFGPTHEEVITDIVRRELHSYKQLPINYFQIQTKFRDEIRPRFGVMRAREFIMKDAYSFHLNMESLQDTYDAMHAAYTKIFKRMGLKFRPVRAGTGSIGGNFSHEFHVLAESGEDAIAFSDAGDYASNIELAEALPPAEKRPAAKETMERVETPGVRTIDDLCGFLRVPIEKTLKTLIIKCADDSLVALVLRGDHELNMFKVGKLESVTAPIAFATAKEIRDRLGCSPGSIGPVGLKLPYVVDHVAANTADFIAGANKDDVHLRGINWERDAPANEVADLRNVVDGDPSPDGKGTLSVARGIEVGHIFQLGDKYSEAMQAKVTAEDGSEQTLSMGCYGIGITRIVAAAIEQNNDAQGIIWPAPIAPFDVVLLPMNLHKSEAVKKETEAIYDELKANGFDVLMDDREVRPGIMFADMELIGIPLRVVVGERSLKENKLEWKSRDGKESGMVDRKEIVALLRERTEQYA